MLPLSAFFRFIAVLCFNSFTAICSLRDKLYFDFCVITSASLTLTFSKELSRATEGYNGGIQLDFAWNGCFPLWLP